MEAKVLCSAFVLIFAVSYSDAQKTGFGFCPKTQLINDFQVTKYLGKWFEIAKYPTLFQRGDCTEANYGPVDEFGQVKVLNKEITDEKVIAVRGVAEQNKMHRSDLQVYLHVPFVGAQQSDYNVLTTDYDSYALVYACRQILGALKFEFAWILSRERTLSPEATAEIDEVMKRNGLDKSALVVTRQTECPDLDSLPYSLIA